MKKNFFIAIFFTLIFTQASHGYSTDPKQFISEIVSEAKKVLVNSNTKGDWTRLGNINIDRLFIDVTNGDD